MIPELVLSPLICTLEIRRIDKCDRWGGSIDQKINDLTFKDTGNHVFFWGLTTRLVKPQSLTGGSLGACIAFASAAGAVAGGSTKLLEAWLPRVYYKIKGKF